MSLRRMSRVVPANPDKSRIGGIVPNPDLSGLDNSTTTYTSSALFPGGVRSAGKLTGLSMLFRGM